MARTLIYLILSMLQQMHVARVNTWQATALCHAFPSTHTSAPPLHPTRPCRPHPTPTQPPCAPPSTHQQGGRHLYATPLPPLPPPSTQHPARTSRVDATSMRPEVMSGASTKSTADAMAEDRWPSRMRWWASMASCAETDRNRQGNRLGAQARVMMHVFCKPPGSRMHSLMHCCTPPVLCHWRGKRDGNEQVCFCILAD